MTFVEHVTRRALAVTQRLPADIRALALAQHGLPPLTLSIFPPGSCFLFAFSSVGRRTMPGSKSLCFEHNVAEEPSGFEAANPSDEPVMKRHLEVTLQPFDRLSGKAMTRS
jgi:hypothetical protein